jgi:4-hydroxybenzoate polyprenyltransferase
MADPFNTSGMPNARRPLLVALLLAAHPLAAVVMAAAMVIAAALSGGRDAVELLTVGGAVLVGQLTIGWVGDIADRHRDRQAGRDNRPIAMGWVSASTAAWSTAYATCVLVPLALTNGTEAGSAYLLSVVVAWVGTRTLRGSVLSFLPAAISFALLPTFLSYGGSGGGSQGDPPTVAISVAAAFVGIGVHFLTTLPDLVGDNTAGLNHLPLRIAKRIGAAKLLWATVVYLAVAIAVTGYVGATVGLRQ